MSLRPEASVTASLATAALVYAVFQISLPNVVDVRAAPPGDAHIRQGERVATWTAAGLAAGVALIARDMNIFILGGAATIAFSWYYKHGNMVNPITKVANSFTNSQMAPPAAPMAGAEPGYGMPAAPVDAYAFG